MEPSFEIDPIVLKYIREEQLMPEESVLLHHWLAAAEGRKEMLERIKAGDDWTMAQLAELYAIGERLDSHKAAIIARLEREGHLQPADSSISTLITKPQAASRSWFTWTVAASVILLLGVATIFILRRHPAPTSITPQPPPTADIKPGGDKATLTLSDGRQIDLDSSANGVLALQGNMNVTRLGDGQLAYIRKNDEKPLPLAYNILSTPRAGQFPLQLPDGSRVWLNNASSIRYPVAFTGPDRTVDLAGEAYFEIARDAAHPFRVRVHRQQVSDASDGGSVEVLGTSFNIMAYSDEPAEQTTLVDGSVRFIQGSHNALLRPGQQSDLDTSGAFAVLPKVNIPEVTAWKNGFFHFDHASLETTMRQLARWYDIDVKYEGHPAEQQFVGRIPRSLALTTVLKDLENYQVHFRLEGRTLTVIAQ